MRGKLPGARRDAGSLMEIGRVVSEEEMKARDPNAAGKDESPKAGQNAFGARTHGGLGLRCLECWTDLLQVGQGVKQQVRNKEKGGEQCREAKCRRVEGVGDKVANAMIKLHGAEKNIPTVEPE